MGGGTTSSTSKDKDTSSANAMSVDSEAMYIKTPGVHRPASKRLDEPPFPVQDASKPTEPAAVATEYTPLSSSKSIASLKEVGEEETTTSDVVAVKESAGAAVIDESKQDDNGPEVATQN